MKTNWRKTFNKDYLGSWDLDDGEAGYVDLKVTIKEVSMKTIKDPMGQSEQVRIATFVEGIKPLILNVGACEMIESFTKSQYIDDWGGCKIQLFVDTNAKLFQGLRGAAVRIRSKQPADKLPTMNKKHKRWPDLVAAYAEKGEAAIEAAKQGYELSDAAVKQIQKEAADGAS